MEAQTQNQDAGLEAYCDVRHITAEQRTQLSAAGYVLADLQECHGSADVRAQILDDLQHGAAKFPFPVARRLVNPVATQAARGRLLPPRSPPLDHACLLLP